ncbi:MAG: hypothetical protein K940chlam3_00388 [Chlamydiae bacterium]|nr:hypothetical protein [Chlamydiota bacterium]
MRLKGIFFLGLLFYGLCFGAEIVPRKVIAIYDGQAHHDLVDTRAHIYAEMPLNHLGVRLEYYDVQRELPDIGDDPNVIGVLSWLDGDSYLDIEIAMNLLEWMIGVLKTDKKFVQMGYVPFEGIGNVIPEERREKFWKLLGLRNFQEWYDNVYDVEVKANDPVMTNFEREYPSYEAPFQQLGLFSPDIKIFLSATHSDSSFIGILGAITPKGAYIADGYAVYYLWDEDLKKQWYINPFLFFKKAFNIQSDPKPDTTTIAGRRIFYSHIDGDGWNNKTEIKERYPRRTLASKVILEEIPKVYTDLPCTVAPIAADIDMNWVGTVKSDDICREFFELPNVEVGCHTYTHPFDMQFFEDYREEDEYPYLHFYSDGSWLGNPVLTMVKQMMLPDYEKKEIEKGYDAPRAFALKPFEVRHEIIGAIEKVGEYCPKDKKVALYQWSGNCRPFYQQLVLLKEAKVDNINGGDSRFDSVFPSYAWVAPLGRWVKNYFQVYASNSNENTYTDFWKSNFSGFRMLKQTLINTESPIRVKPINVYYHMYSGQKLASLNALKQNLDYARTQKIVPITASDFTKIAQGFNSTGIRKIESHKWKILNRGALQTFRFDKSSSMAVDYQNSVGVVGQKYLHGSLYVYLDEDVDEPIISLKESAEFHREPREKFFYLIDSRWRVNHLQPQENAVEFVAQGFGDGEMLWNVPEDGDYLVSVDGEETRHKSEDLQLHFRFSVSAIDPISVSIRKALD